MNTTPNSPSDAWQACIWLAVGTSDWELVKRLEENGVTLDFNPSNDQFSVLYQAIREFGDVPDTIAWLVHHGASVSARGLNGMTALHLAARQGNVNSVRTLLAFGAEINSSTVIDGGWTPLMEASDGGQLDAVRVLLSFNADVSIANSRQGTAADIAGKRGFNDIVEVLRQAAKSKKHDRVLS